jgi:hypothetical protein
MSSRGAADSVPSADGSTHGLQQQVPRMPPAGAAVCDSAESRAHTHHTQHHTRQRQQQQQQLPRSESEDDGVYSDAAGALDGRTAAADSADSSGDGADGSSSQQRGQLYSEAELEAMIGGTLNRRYWEAIHDGVGSVRDVYSIRGPHYLRDRKKIPAGERACGGVSGVAARSGVAAARCSSRAARVGVACLRALHAHSSH